MPTNSSELRIANASLPLAMAYLNKTEKVHPRISLLIAELMREFAYVRHGVYPPDPVPLGEELKILRMALPAREIPHL